MTFTCVLFDHDCPILFDPRCVDSKDVSVVCYCGAPGWIHEREWRTSIVGRLKPCMTCSTPTIGRVKNDPICHACWVGGTLDFVSGEPVKATV